MGERQQNMSFANNVSTGRGKRRFARSTNIIPREDVRVPPEKVRIVGGDSDELGNRGVPTIIVSKTEDRITGITVKCPCGRTAELVCEYNV